MHGSYSRLLTRLWFAADFVLALAPLYWIFAPQSTTGGVPTVLVYLFATASFITASVVWAYVAVRRVPVECR